MRNKILFILSFLGLVGGAVVAYVSALPEPPQPPVFRPAPNPYANGIYATGIVESAQTHGENINLFPDVSGQVTNIFVTDGQAVRKGTPLIAIDDTVQEATVEQQRAQAQAAHALLGELKAEPRRENLRVAQAQVEVASANLKTAQDQLDKQERSYRLDSKSVSKDVLDSAVDAAQAAKANLDVAQRQYQLTKAGAWIYDIRNQQRQYVALEKAYAASSALLAKYTIRAPSAGVVLSVGAAVGSYVSPQGAYDTYTQGFDPVVVMGGPEQDLQVRCYVDEILVPRLPPTAKMTARMYVRGTNVSVPLRFVRMQPYLTPKIELSDQRQERVDVRVLPIIFAFKKPGKLKLYPGQLVDVYIGEK